jgi:CheY-like chemotaxis protein
MEKRPGERPVRSRRILAAEDNLINQLVVAEELKALGYEVTPVGNGLEAVEAVKTGRYDLALMDCQMPVLDGYQATQRIRQLAGNPGRIPIIALTAHALREDLERCLAVGMNDYLTKPFREEALRQKLDRWLGDGMEVEAPVDAAETSAETEGIDRVLFDQFRELARASGHDFLRQLAEGFRSRPHISEMHAALLHQDRKALQFHAHSLKGSSSMLGAARLSQLCATLEHMTREATDEECSRLLSQIESEYTGFLFKLMAAV